jgi:hypothetical protein
LNVLSTYNFTQATLKTAVDGILEARTGPTWRGAPVDLNKTSSGKFSCDASLFTSLTFHNLSSTSFNSIRQSLLLPLGKYKKGFILFKCQMHLAPKPFCFEPRLCSVFWLREQVHVDFEYM